MNKVEIAEKLCKVIGDTYVKAERLGDLIQWGPYEYFKGLEDAPVLILDILDVPVGDYSRDVVISHLRGDISFDNMLNTLDNFKAEMAEEYPNYYQDN